MTKGLHVIANWGLLKFSYEQVLDATHRTEYVSMAWSFNVLLLKLSITIKYFPTAGFNLNPYY